MYKQVDNIFENNNFKIKINKEPDICPICNRHLMPAQVSVRFIKTDNVQIVFQCLNGECHNLFIASYRHDYKDDTYYLVNLQPIKYEGTSFSQEISSVSQSFIDIYNQSEEAEQFSLELISGVGFRKSLEFLIKDYLIQIFPDKESEIKSTLLGRCIDNWIDDPKIKQCAKLAAWLGNDETHYERKWETKDINDLKTLIRLTIIWIESNLLTLKYIEEMK